MKPVRSALFILACWGLNICLSRSGLSSEISIQSQSTVLNIGYVESAFYDLRVKDAQVALEMWGSSLINRETSPLNKVSAAIIPSFEELERAVKKEELDVIIMGTIDYLRLGGLGLLEPVLAPNSRGESLHSYILVVHKDTGLKDLGQIKSKNLICGIGGEGDLPKVWLETVLLKEGLGQLETFFRQIKYVDKSSQAVLPVFFKQADACLVSARSFESLKELNPQIGNNLVVLRTSPRFLRGLICFRRSRDEEQKRVTLETMKKMHEDPQGQQILILFHEDRLVPFQSSSLASTEILLQEHNTLLSKMRTSR